MSGNVSTPKTSTPFKQETMDVRVGTVKRNRISQFYLKEVEMRISRSTGYGLLAAVLYRQE